MEGGTLYVVGTPIGNLEDITLRALRVLREVDLVAAEDTRAARVLMSHHAIHTPMVSLHRDNEARRCGELLTRLRDGQALALIGSRQLLEIAVNQANAAEKFHVSKGDTVFITFQKTP